MAVGGGLLRRVQICDGNDEEIIFMLLFGLEPIPLLK